MYSEPIVACEIKHTNGSTPRSVFIFTPIKAFNTRNEIVVLHILEQLTTALYPVKSHARFMHEVIYN
jgi:hypothetical protein